MDISPQHYCWQSTESYGRGRNRSRGFQSGFTDASHVNLENVVWRQPLVDDLIHQLSQPSINLQPLPGESQTIHCINDDLYTMYFVLNPRQGDGAKICDVKKLVDIISSYEDDYPISFEILVLKAKTTGELVFCIHMNCGRHTDNDNPAVIASDTTCDELEPNRKRAISECLDGEIQQCNGLLVPVPMSSYLPVRYSLVSYKLYVNIDRDNGTYDLYDAMNRLHDFMYPHYGDNYMCYLPEDWENTDPNKLTVYLQWYEAPESADGHNIYSDDEDDIDENCKQISPDAMWWKTVLFLVVMIISVFMATVFHCKYRKHLYEQDPI